ncbi:hypothetical protein PFISCL1PPCAC_17839, partial [Pristionchus fissidentatus]
VLVTRSLLAIVAVVLLTVLHVNRRKFSAHRSLKMLLDWHSFWIYLICFPLIADYAWTAVTLFTMKSPSDLIVTDVQCVWRAIIICLCIYGSVCSMFAMSIERYRASTEFATYEKSYKNYGYKLAIGHLIFNQIKSRNQSNVL